MSLYYRISPWLVPPLVVPMLLRTFDCHSAAHPMTITKRFGKKLKVPRMRPPEAAGATNQREARNLELWPPESQLPAQPVDATPSNLS